MSRKQELRMVAYGDSSDSDDDFKWNNSDGRRMSDSRNKKGGYIQESTDQTQEMDMDISSDSSDTEKTSKIEVFGEHGNNTKPKQQEKKNNENSYSSERNRRRERSRSRDRDRRRAEKSGHRRRRSRSRSRSRGRRSLSRGRRSHSRGRRSHSRGKDRYRRSRSRERSRRRSRSRSPRRHRRSRSRSRERERSREDFRLGFKRSRALAAGAKAQGMTPSELLRKQMEAQVEKVKEMTGVELPKYYNPAAMNPLRFAEQEKKKRLLWGNKGKAKPAEDPAATPAVTPVAAANVTTAASTVSGSANQWESTIFSQDQDGKMTAKFKKLMGIKVGSEEAAAADGNTELNQKQHELFKNLDEQYEMARLSTHTHRGMGLGYTSAPPKYIP